MKIKIKKKIKRSLSSNVIIMTNTIMSARQPDLTKNKRLGPRKDALVCCPLYILVVRHLTIFAFIL